MLFFFFKQKTAYEMRISDWSSDVCSSDLLQPRFDHQVDMAAGEQSVIITVAAEDHALVRCLRRERHEMLTVMIGKILRAGRREDRVGKAAADARRRGFAPEQGRPPRRPDPALAGDRLKNGRAACRARVCQSV